MNALRYLFDPERGPRGFYGARRESWAEVLAAPFVLLLLGGAFLAAMYVGAAMVTP